MDQVIKNLKAKEIIYGKTVEALKNYIGLKYPELGEADRAQIFADAVHKILDDHVKDFSRSYQREIKQDLLLRTAKKDRFEIVAYDIMKTCVALGVDEEAFFDDLTSWINHEQEVTVYRHQLSEITDIVQEDLDAEAALEDVDREQGLVGAVEEDSDQKELMAQLDAAFDYNPSEPSETGTVVPELFSEGEINHAYEDEIRRDALQDGMNLDEAEVLDDSLWPREGEVVTEAPVVPVEDPSLIVTEEESLIEDPIDAEPTFVDTELEVTLDEEPIFADLESEVAADEQEDRPVVKVEMDIEPYFSETPEAWASDETKKTWMENLFEEVTGGNLKVIALLSAGILAIVALSVWLVWWLLLQPEVSTIPVETVIEQAVVPEEPAPTPVVTLVEEEVEAPQTGDRRSKSSDHLDPSIRFKEIDSEALKAWLLRNESMVGEEPHFTTIIEVAQDYGVNPLLLFAITGQEQSFVPKNHEFADQMINNPFNVYGSWEKYNTDLKESAQIAARTVLTASENKPEEVDPVVWINETYAEDPNWATGVNLILEQFEIVAGNR